MLSVSSPDVSLASLPSSGASRVAGRTWVRGAAGWAVAVALMGWCFRSVEPEAVVRTIADTGPWLALALVPQLIGLSLETWGWRTVLREAGHPVAFRPLWAIRVATEAVGQMLPGGALVGESIKPGLLERHCGLAVPVGIAATAHRKYVRLLGHGLYVLAGVLLGGHALRSVSSRWLGTSGLDLLLFAVGLGLLGAALLLSQLLGRGRLAERVHGLLSAFPLGGRLARHQQSFSDADHHTSRFFALRRRRLVLPVAAATTAWCCEALESWLILHLLGGALGLGSVMGFELSISLARQMLFLLPAGLGVQEAGYMSALSAVGPDSIVSLAAAFVVVKRLKEIGWSVFGFGLLGLLGWRRREASRSARTVLSSALPRSATA
jgi:uncharacterized protein (TIRG00374 family)